MAFLSVAPHLDQAAAPHGEERSSTSLSKGRLAKSDSQFWFVRRTGSPLAPPTLNPGTSTYFPEDPLYNPILWLELCYPYLTLSIFQRGAVNCRGWKIFFNLSSTFLNRREWSQKKCSDSSQTSKIVCLPSAFILYRRSCAGNGDSNWSGSRLSITI